MAVIALILTAALPANAAPAVSLAMRGSAALPDNFDHLPYADPQAVKAGRITYGLVGTFDSLNPFIVNGNAPRGISDTLYGNNVFETLMVRSADEPFTLYALLARSVEIADDRSWILFHLDPRARFSDGVPVTAADVMFSIKLLRDKGRPVFRTRFSRIAAMEASGEHDLKITFVDGSDRELPLLVAGSTPILPSHATDPATFDQTTWKPPIGSGPYTIARVDPGSGFTLRRNSDYWGRDIPSKRGFDNFDEIRFDYYRDANSYFEAFKSGAFDFLIESNPERWSTGYDFPAIASGDVRRLALDDRTPKGMNALVFNLRRPIFADRRVREALNLIFDFEWINKTLYFGAYRRTASFFENSVLSSVGRPAGDREKALLAPFAGAVTPAALAGTMVPVTSDGSGRDRANLRRALQLLAEAGWTLEDGTLKNTATGAPFRFEFMASTREEERLALAFQTSLHLIGIEMQVRLVDSTQFFDRQKKFDFDMVHMYWPASLSPGNEEQFRWSSAAADTEGTFNLAGLRSPAADRMIGALLAADGEDDFEAAVRALDRVLISAECVIPLFNLPQSDIALRARLGVPDRIPLYGIQPVTLWARH